jgi:prevent-host-death family protein
MRIDTTVTVTAAEFQRNIGTYQDIALTKAVTITKNGRERTVLISAQEYERLKRRGPPSGCGWRADRSPDSGIAGSKSS